jgi:hypothetical protein
VRHTVNNFILTKILQRDNKAFFKDVCFSDGVCVKFEFLGTLGWKTTGAVGVNGNSESSMSIPEEDEDYYGGAPGLYCQNWTYVSNTTAGTVIWCDKWVYY